MAWGKIGHMSKHSSNSDNNPLDEFAAKLSRQLNSEPVEFNESTTDHVEGGQIWMKNSAARSIEASAVHLEESAAALVHAHTVDVHKGVIGGVAAHDATLTRTTNTLLLAKHVEAQEVQAGVIFALRLEGNVKATLTPLTAFAAGAGLAAAVFILKRIIALPFLNSSGKGMKS